MSNKPPKHEQHDAFNPGKGNKRPSDPNHDPKHGDKGSKGK